MVTTCDEKVINLVRQAGILRPRDLDKYELPKSRLNRLERSGQLERIARGLYSLPHAKVSEYHTLAQTAKLSPNGVACLLTALEFHDITTQSPFEIWWAIDVKARAPKLDDLSTRIVRFSGKALTEGIEHHTIEGVTVPITALAKTVADCFKYRNKIGLDVAIEALRDSINERKTTMDELWYYAKICRVQNVMRPYLETIV